MIEEIRNKIANALRLLYSSYNEVATIDIEINRTTNKTHGDLYTNIAMKLAKIVKKKSTGYSRRDQGSHNSK